MVIGVLALQGAFREHDEILTKLGIETLSVRTIQDFDHIDGLILPGGESTVMMKLLDQLGLVDKLKHVVNGGLPVWGTCAGMILLSDSHLALSDMTAKRNAFGRQSGSFQAPINFEGVGKYPSVFIRAPLITRASKDHQVLAVYNEDIVALRDRHILATAFHPELTDDTRIHEYFIKMVRNSL